MNVLGFSSPVLIVWLSILYVAAMQLLDGETVYFSDSRTMRAMLKLLRAQACAASGETENWQMAVALCDEVSLCSDIKFSSILLCTTDVGFSNYIV